MLTNCHPCNFVLQFGKLQPYIALSVIMLLWVKSCFESCIKDMLYKLKFSLGLNFFAILVNELRQ